MFQADTAFAAELIALVLGTGLLIWVKDKKLSNTGFANIVAYFVIVASIVSMLCTGYYSFRYWEDGYFHSKPMPMNMMNQPNDKNSMEMMHQQMMNKHMKMMMDKDKNDESMDNDMPGAND